MFSCCAMPRTVKEDREQPKTLRPVSDYVPTPPTGLFIETVQGPQDREISPEQYRQLPSQQGATKFKPSPPTNLRKDDSPTPELEDAKESETSSDAGSYGKPEACALWTCGDSSCMRNGAPHPYACPVKGCNLVFVEEATMLAHSKTNHLPAAKFTLGLEPITYGQRKKMELTSEQRKERQAKNAAARNAKRKADKAKALEFVQKPKVFARVRPLARDEEKDSYIMPGLNTKTQFAADLGEGKKVCMFENDILTGFEGCMGIETTNKEVYDATLKPQIDFIVNGGQCSLFCYGHTGTGKTHTSMGYGSDPGLFKHACADILTALEKHNVGLAKEDQLFIQVRFTEVHLRKVFDLLTNPKEECMIREDDQGNFRLRMEVRRNEKGHMVTGDQKFATVNDIDHLLEVLETGIKTRACGSSSIHDQSSRSHAMMEMEVVNQRLNDVRNAVQDLDALLTHAIKEENKGSVIYTYAKIQVIKKQLKDAKKAEALFIRENPTIGGTLTLVDLAGADFDHRTYGESQKVEQRESMEINKQLYAIKECMRTDISSKPWRESNLAKILKKVLDPKGRKAQAIMVANISPAMSQERSTLNTLKYAQMVSGYEDDKKKTADAARARDMKRQIRAAYKQHCPEKSSEEVEEILDKWEAKGKLNRLLQLVWKKYVNKA